VEHNLVDIKHISVNHSPNVHSEWKTNINWFIQRWWKTEPLLVVWWCCFKAHWRQYCFVQPMEHDLALLWLFRLL